MPEFKKRDESQLAVLNIDTGYNLVLAPPGCGKTDILAERIARALQNGISPEDMLCLTFTNRAARGMRARIESVVGKAIAEQIFIGNVHRFCSKFLFENSIIPNSYSIIDEDDANDIINNLNEKNKYGKDACELIISYQHYKYPGQDKFGIIKNLYAEKTQKKQHDKNKLDKAKEKCAKEYFDYKQQYGLLDFDDLLIETYNYFSNESNGYKKYKWIQIDEVQDLNAIQMDIVYFLTDKENNPVVVYLGDEQQSIFSFMGANTGQIANLRKRCEGHIFSFSNNYRSPKYLLEIFNTYAEKELKIDKNFLPKNVSERQIEPGDLQIINVYDNLDQDEAIFALLEQYLKKNRNDKTAILVPANNIADYLGERLLLKNYDFFKISGRDIFATPVIQTILAHISLFCFETNTLSTAKILRIIPDIFTDRRYYHSRKLAKEMQENALCLDDIIQYPNSSYIQNFISMYPKRIILFDTETTGTNVFEDDIVQIAAFKIFQGKITDKCNIFLETEKEIPTMLGNIKNPLLDTYNDPKTKKFQRNEGLQAFLDFLKDSDSIIAHNIQFDYYILDNNIQRDLKIPSFKNDHPIYFDTLKISKLLYPKLPSYKLKALISHLHLEGNNSHMADDDVFATKSLLDACFNKAKEILPKQKNFLASNTDALNKIRKLYLEPYRHTQENLYRKTDRILLVDEIKWLYKYFTENEIIKKPKNTNFDDKIDSVFLLFEKIMAEDLGKYLIEQISNHILKLTTFKEADIYENDIIDKKIFISTVHKAKGLEFENVIVTDVVDGWYPFFSSNTKDKKAEDKRKFYVAISRAQKRLALLTYKYYHSISKNTSKENLECSWQYPKTQSEFLTTILELFNNTQEKES